MSKRNYVYVAFDSDALSLLARVHQLRQKGIHINYQTDPDALIRRYAGYAGRVLDLIYSGEIRPFIVNTVYQQTQFMDFIGPFIKEYGYFSEITQDNKFEKKTRIRRLADAYCAPYLDKNQKPQKPPMEKEYSAYFDIMVPESDAMAMAEATDENCYFVTCNEKHFIYFKGREEKKERLMGIISINTMMGFGDETEIGLLVPRPMGFGTFGALVKDGIESLRLGQPQKTISAKTGEVDDLSK